MEAHTYSLISFQQALPTEILLRTEGRWQMKPVWLQTTFANKVVSLMKIQVKDAGKYLCNCTVHICQGCEQWAHNANNTIMKFKRGTRKADRTGTQGYRSYRLVLSMGRKLHQRKDGLLWSKHIDRKRQQFQPKLPLEVACLCMSW